MRSMRGSCRWIRAIVFCVSGLLPVLVTTYALAQTSEDPGRAVDLIFAEWTDPDSPGAAVAVVQNGRTVLSRGYGLANVEYHVPVTTDTPFDIGSVTKQFTAFAVAVLVEQGKISLSDDIRKFIPEMRIHGGPIRIQHLLDHTSGLRDEFNLLTMEGYGVDDAITFEHSLRLITNQEELLFEPGERWEYSNSGYTLLAEIISRVSGQPYAAWMEENVFTPLGMTHTIFPASAGTIIKGKAYSYTEGSTGLRATVVNKSSLGCSNLYSTVEDISKWAINLASPRVGGRSVVNRMNEPGILNDGAPTNYAFGQFVGKHLGARTFSHGGGIGGYRSALIRFPDQDLAVVVLANADYFNAMRLAKDVAGVFIGHLLEDSTSAVESTATDEPDARKAVELKDCVGTYRLESTGKILEVVMQDTVLALKNLATEGKVLTLSRSRRNDFTVDGMELRLSFAKDEQGGVNRLILHVGDPPQIAARTSVFKMTEDELRKFVGTYLSRELLVVYSLEIKNGVLVASHSRLPPITLLPTGPAGFTGDKAWLRDIRFELDKAEKPVGFRADAAYAKNVYFEKLK